MRFPEGMEALCCGTPFESKGFIAQADDKAAELEAALLEATDGGRLPVLCDTSPCLYRMRKTMDRRLTLLDPVEFTLTHLMERLQITPVAETIAYHHTCSSVKMGLEAKALTLAAGLRRARGRARARGLLRVRRRPRLQLPRAQRLGARSTCAAGVGECSAAIPPAAPARSACRPTAASTTSRSSTSSTAVAARSRLWNGTQLTVPS